MTTLSTDSSTKPLRKCRVCGLEAWTEEELEKFVKRKGSRYGRENLCCECARFKSEQYRKNNPLKIRYGSMLHRCYNPNNIYYHCYGERGISVCEEWSNDRQAFIDWAKANGFKHKLQLDRIDNDGPYSPENCRWVTSSQQALNNRRTVTDLEKGTRICYKCKIEKPLFEFYSDRSTIGALGFQYLCKDCDKKYRKERLKIAKQSKKL